MNSEMPAPVEDADSRRADSTLKYSIAAARAATTLRVAKAVLLLTTSFGVLLMVGLPLLLQQPRKWFGFEFGPPDDGSPGVAAIRSAMKELREQLARDGVDVNVFQGFDKRLTKIESLIDRLNRRTLTNLTPFSIVLENFQALRDGGASTVAVEVTPVIVDESGELSTFETRTFALENLETPTRLFNGAQATCRLLTFKLACVDATGTTLCEATAKFFRISGRWDGPTFATVLMNSERLVPTQLSFRIQLGG